MFVFPKERLQVDLLFSGSYESTSNVFVCLLFSKNNSQIVFMRYCGGVGGRDQRSHLHFKNTVGWYIISNDLRKPSIGNSVLYYHIFYYYIIFTNLKKVRLDTKEKKNLFFFLFQFPEAKTQRDSNIIAWYLQAKLAYLTMTHHS